MCHSVVLKIVKNQYREEKLNEKENNRGIALCRTATDTVG